MIQLMAVKDLAKDLQISTRSCYRLLADLRREYPDEKALHRSILNKKVFTKEDYEKVIELCLNLNQEKTNTKTT